MKITNCAKVRIALFAAMRMLVVINRVSAVVVWMVLVIAVASNPPWIAVFLQVFHLAPTLLAAQIL